MLSEPRRRAVLSAMQVDCWLPRAPLPFAAPPRAFMLLPTQTGNVQAQRTAQAAQPLQAAKTSAAPAKARRENAEKLRGSLAAVAKEAPVQKRQTDKTAVQQGAVPRFSLQLLRAGDCLLLLDLPYGEPLQSREPAFLLLLDLLRAAQLPSPAALGEPVHWPLLANPSVAQGFEAARGYVQSFVLAQQAERCACLWLLGEDARRFAGADDSAALFAPLTLAPLGAVWPLPALPELLSQPPLKRALWQAMRQILPSWQRHD